MKDTKEEAGWESWLARTTAILAILAALSSGRWGASNLQAILEQGKVNDGWDYYQSKSVKQHLAERSRDLALALAGDVAPGRSGSLAELEARLAVEVERLQGEKKVVEEDTRSFERLRDHHVRSSFWFELAFAIMQVGVILSTIAAATKKRWLWVMSIVGGLAGVLLLANGVLHVLPTPSIYRQAGPKLQNPAVTGTPK